jgi:N-acetylglutamate synthase-like GNAT family acetyltransferase
VPSPIETLITRPAAAADVPQIVQLISDIWAEYGCVLDTRIEERYLLAPADYFHARRGEFWVVQRSNVMVATVGVMLLDDKCSELKSLYVDPKERGSGLGERLTRLAMEFAKRAGASMMILWTDTRFTRAHRLYERLGFIRTGTRKLDDINDTTEFGYQIELR